ncbi:ChbG/HpnK family deacetylase [Chitiniphilus eburneus]|nr:ChbG/HpnK family deacetylase [Chitiniphilus eburneus]
MKPARTPLRMLAVATALLASSVVASDLSICLGFKPDDKVLVVNADDVGMHPDLDRAAFALIDGKKIQSLSLMPPTPNFKQAAQMAVARKLPVGVHLTLTNEWQAAQPWGAVLPQSEVPSLYNPQGRLWATTQEVARHAKPEEAKKELLAQIARARAAGLTITHLDAHMVFWGASPELLWLYVGLPAETGIPVVMQGNFMPLDKQMAAARELQGGGALTPDAFFMQYKPAQRHEGKRYAGYDGLFAQLPAGISHLAIHPARDSASARAAIADLTLRLSDFEAWNDANLGKLGQGVKRTDYRALKALQEKINTGDEHCLK